MALAERGQIPNMNHIKSGGNRLWAGEGGQMESTSDCA